MSGITAFLPCPLCTQVGVFKTVESLRDKLIHVSTNRITCPVCQEEIVGLDKLTVHLFSHVNLCVSSKDSEPKTAARNKNENDKCCDSSKKVPSVCSKNKPQTNCANLTPKYVKIRPKLSVILDNSVSLLDVPQICVNENSNNSLNCPLNKNKESFSNNADNTYACNDCGLKFAETKILEVHKSLIHNNSDNSIQNPNRYQCHLCSKKFKMRGSLMVHLRVAHYGFLSCDRETTTKTQQENKSIPINKDDRINNFERNDNKQWQCDVCQKYFTTKYFLKKHKRLHTGETPYACGQCNKTFTFQQSYHKHLLYHNDEKPHICNHCGRAFKELSTLHNHQRIHTGEKPFSCETCGKCFRQRVSYLVHRRIHTGVMPYKCTSCQKSFRYKVTPWIDAIRCSQEELVYAGFVSQRTHKCLAQPPGTVVRQPGDLVEKLRRKQTHLEDVQTTCNKSKNSFDLGENYTEISESNAELVRSGAKLSLEDMESEHFKLLPDCFNDQLSRHSDHPLIPRSAQNNVKNFEENIEQLIEYLQDEDKSIPSPSDILQNLCLSNDSSKCNEYSMNNE